MKFDTKFVGVTTLHSCGAGVQLHVAKTRTDLTAGRWSPDLKAWFRCLLEHVHGLSPTLTAYFKLLRDCNTAVLLTQNHGFETSLQLLGIRCAEASKQIPDIALTSVQQGRKDPSNLVTVLLWDLAERVCTPSRACLALKAVKTSLVVGFPRFKALVKLLQDMVSSREAFHGIVFVKRRQGVQIVAGMLCNMPGIATAVTFHTFTGHPAKTKTQLAQEGAHPSEAGMPTHRQQDALRQFDNANGREVLVATAAAQEGLDIRNCSFVMCYDVTECGVQLMQWRGRTRMFDSRICIILESGSSDEIMFRKACMEETNDRLAQVQLTVEQVNSCS